MGNWLAHFWTTGVDALVICGPSGVGKGTLIGRLRKEFPDRFGFSVSHTSRAPRPGERNGSDYHFTTREEMEAMDARGEFLEMCGVHGNLYGTSVAAVKQVREESGKVCIIEVDVKGAQKLKANQEKLKMFFMYITVEEEEELERRIRKRGAESEELIKVRLHTAQEEAEFTRSNPNFFNAILVNDDLETTYQTFVEIICAQMPSQPLRTA